MTGAPPPTAAEDLGRLLARLRAEAGLPIAAARPDEPAEITVEFLPRKAMQRLVPRAACFVAPRVSSWDGYRRASRASLDWATLQVRDQAAIFVPNDTAPQEVRDCLHEELAQALGPLNDLYRLPDSVFNDDNIHTVLTGFDMLMLRATYAPELHSGMTAGAVVERLPDILAAINPRGERGPAPMPDPTPRAFIDAIETALGPGASGARRRAAAASAVRIAEERGWRDARAGFAWLALGRLSLGHDRAASRTAFARAADVYAGRPEGARPDGARGAAGCPRRECGASGEPPDGALGGARPRRPCLRGAGGADRQPRLCALWLRIGYRGHCALRQHRGAFAGDPPMNRQRTERGPE
jgi:hypothetical protein